MKEHRKAVIRGLLHELVKDADLLGKVDTELGQAEANFDVASRKYAAVRDTVTKYLGYSPYEEGHREIEPVILNGNQVVLVQQYGRYRFIHMTIGNAVIAALKEVPVPLALEEIVQRLLEGGIRRSESTLVRAVNAALMRTKGVQRNKDGKYVYVKDTEIPEGF
jgi:hypothetical protein